MGEFDDMCPHFVSPVSNCVMCENKLNVVMKCIRCSLNGGQTWHLIEGEMATCRKCGTVRGSPLVDGDMGISNEV